AVAAYVEETPGPGTSRPGDPFGGRTPPPGPIYVITPGAENTGGLPPTADPEDVEEQIERDRATSAPGATPTPAPSPGASPSAGASEEPGAAETSAPGA